MSDFNKAIKVVLLHEGGFVDNPNDPGGATIYGLTLNFIKLHPSDCDYNKDGIVDINDLKSMTIQQATDLYQKYFWNWYNFDNINDNTIAIKIFDYSINMGQKHAIELLQQSMNSSLNENVVVDGDMGPFTVATTNKIISLQAQQSFLDCYSSNVWNFYQSLITHNPSLSVFANGWKNRAYSIDKAGMLG